MPRAVRMPPLGETTEELRIVAWLKAEGEAVELGEPLLEVETDKATLEVEAAVSGTLLKILSGPGETVEVGRILAYVGDAGEPLPETGGAPEKRPAVPAARQLAREHGIDLRLVQGSGPGGRIEKRDILAVIEGAVGETGSQGEETLVPPHRQALARRLTRSVQTIPQFTLAVSADMSEAAKLLASQRAAGLTGLTYTHLILSATAQALRAHPGMNRLWVSEGPRLRQLPRADVGLAVAGEETLLVATIPEPDRASLAELVALTEQAEVEARSGTFSQAYWGPVAITVSNLGMYGIDAFSAIVDPDQTAILAAGRVAERAGVVAGAVEVVPQIELTLTVDHRTVDGAAAARFLEAIRTRLEGRGV